MPTYRTVVVGVHDSPTGRRAVELAAPLSSESGAELILVTAYGSGRPAGPAPADEPGGRESYLEPGAEQARRALKRAEEICAAMEVGQVTAVAVEGDPVVALTGAVREHRADLLLVGSHGLGTLGGRLLGSVPGGVAREADCDVLVVHTTRERHRSWLGFARRPPLGYTRTVLVGVHESERALRAAERAGGIAADFDAELLLVGAYRELRRGDHRRASDSLGGESYLVSGRFPVESVLRDAEARARRQGATRVERVVVRGEAMRALLEVAERRAADILVLGNHQLSGRGRRLIGTISEQVTRRTATHVLLVH